MNRRYRGCGGRAAPALLTVLATAGSMSACNGDRVGELSERDASRPGRSSRGNDSAGDGGTSSGSSNDADRDGGQDTHGNDASLVDDPDPASDESATDEPGAGDPSNDDADNDEPSTDEPEPSGGEADDPATDTPATDETQPDEPLPDEGTDDPTSDDPATDDPATDDGTATEPVDEPVDQPLVPDDLFLCDRLPNFDAKTQVVDGIGDEFTNVEAMQFDVSKLPFIDPDYDAAIPTPVTIRAAWSEDAFHAHVHVEDPAVQTDASYTLWNGDNIQLFVAASSTLSGVYSGSEDGGAIHVVIAPEAGGLAARGIVLYEPCYACVEVTTLPTSAFASRLVDDGYEVEVRLPWAASAEPRRSGARFGFDLIVGVSNSLGAGLELQGTLRTDRDLPSESCSPTPFTHPGCDDRVWCQPILE